MFTATILSNKFAPPKVSVHIFSPFARLQAEPRRTAKYISNRKLICMEILVLFLRMMLTSNIYVSNAMLSGQFLFNRLGYPWHMPKKDKGLSPLSYFLSSLNE